MIQWTTQQEGPVPPVPLSGNYNCTFLYTWSDYLAHCSVTFSQRRLEFNARLIDHKVIEWKGIVKSISNSSVVISMVSLYATDFNSDINLIANKEVIESYGDGFRIGIKCKFRAQIIISRLCFHYTYYNISNVFLFL